MARDYLQAINTRVVVYDGGMGATLEQSWQKSGHPPVVSDQDVLMGETVALITRAQ